MRALRQIAHYLERAGAAIGNVISVIVLTVFYFSAFALVAIPFRILSDVLHIRPVKSTWVAREKSPAALADFTAES